MKMINDLGHLRALLCLASLSAFAFSPACAEALQQASVTEAVNSVSYQTSEKSEQKPASTGTIIHPDNVVRTGVKSRAELKFNDNTVTRMGANSVFTFDAQSQKLNLEQGSMLFSKPKDASTFQITTPAATCAISGTSGFLQYLPGGHGGLIFGLIEGHTSLVIGGTTYNLTGGNMLVISPDGTVHIVAFDIAAFLHNAGLITKFKSKLPNQGAIDAALAEYLSLVDRGFIQPPGSGLTNYRGHDWFDPDFLQFVSQIQGFENEASQPPPSNNNDECSRRCCYSYSSTGT